MSEKKEKNERGAGKPSASILVSKKDSKGHFWVPIPVCRELGVQDGGTLEFKRRELESGGVEYVLRPVVRRDYITGRTDGEFIEYQGRDISKETIIELSRMIGLLETKE